MNPGKYDLKLITVEYEATTEEAHRVMENAGRRGITMADELGLPHGTHVRIWHRDPEPPRKKWMKKLKSWVARFKVGKE